jgi:hypothetical protein
MFKIGEEITLCIGNPEQKVPVVILQLNKETGMPAKLKAIRKSESLGKLGFILEGDDWIHSEYQISRN